MLKKLRINGLILFNPFVVNNFDGACVMIYLLTFHYPKNYGAFLQSYVMRKCLDGTLIDFVPDYTFKVSPRGKRKLPFFWRFFALFRKYQAWCKNFPEYSRLTKRKKMAKLFNSNLRNVVFVVGSDQVWNPYHCVNLSKNLYFLDFAPEGARRISYAASLGVKSWPKPFEERVLPMLKKFDAISVREESSVPYLTSLGLKNVVCVCDPTILHTGNFYRNEFPYEKCGSEFTFIYRIREEIPESVRSIFCKEVKEVHLQKRRTIVSVTEWLRNIDCAKFVITDSFHCAVFCILFHKPFLVIPNRSTGKGMNERFSTLLGKTGLEYRCLTCEESRDEVLQKLNASIDWEKVDAILEEWRSYSANWLKNALGE